MIFHLDAPFLKPLKALSSKHKDPLHSLIKHLIDATPIPPWPKFQAEWPEEALYVDLPENPFTGNFTPQKSFRYVFLEHCKFANDLEFTDFKKNTLHEGDLGERLIFTHPDYPDYPLITTIHALPPEEKPPKPTTLDRCFTMWQTEASTKAPQDYMDIRFFSKALDRLPLSDLTPLHLCYLDGNTLRPSPSMARFWKWMILREYIPQNFSYPTGPITLLAKP